MVSTHLKNISQNGNLPQIGVKIQFWTDGLDDYQLTAPFQVGAFNPFEKYARQIGSFPQVGLMFF